MTPYSVTVLWTPERLATLKSLVARGMTYSEIAEELGCTKNAAVSAYHRKIREGKTWSRMTKAEKAQVLRKMNAGAKPTVPFVPGLANSPKYQMLMLQ